MIKKALEYIVGLNAPTIQMIGQKKYSDRELYIVDECKRAISIESSTLTSIIDYIKNANTEIPEHVFVHIVSPDCVRLVSQLNTDRERETLITATAKLPYLRLNEFIDNENFIIMLQSMFVQKNVDTSDFESNDIDLLQKVVGNVVDDTIQTYTDDGISQQAAIKTGVTTKDTVILPSPATLLPFRTFVEIQQPSSKFVFRMKKGHNGPCSALFEADGGAWKNDAMDNIKEFFEIELSDYENVTIIC